MIRGKIRLIWLLLRPIFACLGIGLASFVIFWRFWPAPRLLLSINLALADHGNVHRAAVGANGDIVALLTMVRNDPIEYEFRLLHSRSGNLILRQAASCFAFSPDEKRLAIQTDESLQLLDMKSGENLMKWPLPSKCSEGVGFSHDGTFFAIVVAGESTVLRNMEASEDKLFLDASDPARLVSGFCTFIRDKTLSVHELSGGGLRATVSLEVPILDYDLSLDGSTIVLADVNERLIVWDSQNGQKRERELENGQQPVVSSDGQFLALWTWGTKQRPVAPERSESWFATLLRCLSSNEPPEGLPGISVYDLSDGQRLANFGRATTASFSADCKLLVVVFQDRLEIWTTNFRKPVYRIFVLAILPVTLLILILYLRSRSRLRRRNPSSA